MAAGVIRDAVYLDGGYLWWEPGMADGSLSLPVADGNELFPTLCFSADLYQGTRLAWYMCSTSALLSIPLRTSAQF
jgi:hypothetical protein